MVLASEGLTTVDGRESSSGLFWLWNDKLPDSCDFNGWHSKCVFASCDGVKALSDLWPSTKHVDDVPSWFTSWKPSSMNGLSDCVELPGEFGKVEGFNEGDMEVLAPTRPDHILGDPATTLKPLPWFTLHLEFCGPFPLPVCFKLVIWTRLHSFRTFCVSPSPASSSSSWQPTVSEEHCCKLLLLAGKSEQLDSVLAVDTATWLSRVVTAGDVGLDIAGILTLLIRAIIWEALLLTGADKDFDCAVCKIQSFLPSGLDNKSESFWPPLLFILPPVI